MDKRPAVMLHVVGTSIAWFALGYVLPVVAQESPPMSGPLAMLFRPHLEDIFRRVVAQHRGGSYCGRVGLK